MRNMSRFWMVLVVGASLGMTLFWSTPAKATLLSNTEIDWATFTSFADTDSIVATLIDYFDFSPPTGGYDGAIYSAVFKGTGAADGKYVYVYQFEHYSTSSSSKFSGLSFSSFTNQPPEEIDQRTSFYIVQGAGPSNPPIGFGNWGDHKPVYVHMEPGEISIIFYPPGVPGKPKGGISHLLGFVHSLPPTMVKSNPLDAGPDLLKPHVLTPSPEPSALILLSTGLLGLLGIRRRYLS